MPRAFVAIDIDEEVRNRIVAAQEQLGATGADLKLVEPPNIHVTMKFLGDVPDKKLGEITEALTRGATGTDKFDIGVKGIGVFPNLNYIRVIWAGVDEGKDELVELQRKIEGELEKAGFRREGSFVPHLTIARVRTARQKDKLASFVNEMSSAEFGVTRSLAVELKQSTLTPKGPIYSTLANIKLG
ncbi:MAG: RNA 2',3'-cyclic phosphodiesterase [Methanobacteriota archaeon]